MSPLSKVLIVTATLFVIMELAWAVPNPVANSAPKSIKTKVAKPARISRGERYDDSINEYLTEVKKNNC